jgi:hypothetical protein
MALGDYRFESSHFELKLPFGILYGNLQMPRLAASHIPVL